jgi:hypothetical protein
MQADCDTYVDRTELRYTARLKGIYLAYGAHMR